MNEDNSHIFDKFLPYVSQFTVGFLSLTIEPGHQDARCAGSGTLVSIEGQRGILTAAHVLRELPSAGKVGLLRLPTHSSPNQRFQMEANELSYVVIGSAPWSDRGPDIGFLLLQADVADRLEASSCVFMNLSKPGRREDVLATTQAELTGYYYVIGIVNQFTSDLEPRRKSTYRKNFEASAEAGSAARIAPNGDMDLIQFIPNRDPDLRPIYTYKGVSGGGLWRMHLVEHDDSKLEFSHANLHGVAFYETMLPNGRISITCHGPASVYKSLCEAAASL